MQVCDGAAARNKIVGDRKRAVEQPSVADLCLTRWDRRKNHVLSDPGRAFSMFKGEDGLTLSIVARKVSPIDTLRSPLVLPVPDRHSG